MEILPAVIINTPPTKFYISEEHRHYLEAYLNQKLPNPATPNEVATIFLQCNRAAWPEQLKLYKFVGWGSQPNGWSSGWIYPADTPRFSAPAITVLEAHKNQDLLCNFYTDLSKSNIYGLGEPFIW